MKSTVFLLPFRSKALLKPTVQNLIDFFPRTIIYHLKKPVLFTFCTANLCFSQYSYKKIPCENIDKQKSVKIMKQFFKAFLASENCDCYQNGEGELSDVFYSAKLNGKKIVFTQWDNYKWGNMVSITMPSDKFEGIFKEVALNKSFSVSVISNVFNTNNISLNGRNLLTINVTFDPKDNSFGITPYDGLCCSPVSIYDLGNTKFYNLIYKIDSDYNELIKVKQYDLDIISHNIYKTYGDIIQNP